MNLPAGHELYNSVICTNLISAYQEEFGLNLDEPIETYKSKLSF